MPKPKKIISYFLLTILFSIVTFFLITFYFKKNIKIKSINKKYLEKKIKKLVAKKDKNNLTLPQIIIKEFKMKETSKNKHESWKLISREGKIYKTSNIIECENVSCQLKRGKEEIASIYSYKSILDRNKKNIFLTGKVTGNFKELKIEGSDINYNFSNQTIKTKKVLNYTYPNFNITAAESYFDIKKNRIKMSKGIKTEISNNTTSNNSTN
ncbi:LPS export ABC transporter periplasmic protein LptC [Candidatus Babeliales bacterium]|nr:LPS export ABC transporter periplasmic protein LptC [Candidatus Babeliales bacterium]